MNNNAWRPFQKAFLWLALCLQIGSCATSVHSDNVAAQRQVAAAPEPPSLAPMSMEPITPYIAIAPRSSYFEWPVDNARLTRGFLPKKRKPHLGLDLAAKKGTRILAAHDGTVIYTGRDFRGYGKMVMLEGAKGWATLYAHFSKITVHEGQQVRQGEQIGLMGATGRARGTHLHFELRSERGPVDPLPYLPNGSAVAKLVGVKKSRD